MHTHQIVKYTPLNPRWWRPAFESHCKFLSIYTNHVISFRPWVHSSAAPLSSPAPFHLSPYYPLPQDSPYQSSSRDQNSHVGKLALFVSFGPPTIPSLGTDMFIHLSSTLSSERESRRILLPLSQSCISAAPLLDLVPLKREGDLAIM